MHILDSDHEYSYCVEIGYKNMHYSANLSCKISILFKCSCGDGLVGHPHE